MNFGESLCFYLLVGLAVAVAQALNEEPANPFKRIATLVAAWIFWPLYLPGLLSARKEAIAPGNAAGQGTLATDPLDEAIGQVERELDAALANLGGWAENVLQQKPRQLRDLHQALRTQAERIRQMRAVVSRELAARELVARELADRTTTAIEPTAESPSAAVNSRMARSQRARLENMNRLATVCRHAEADLMGTLAWIRELVSMIQLARFTGAPAARAEELVAQIAAAVESISSLSAVDVSDACETTKPDGSELAAPRLPLSVNSISLPAGVLP